MCTLKRTTLFERLLQMETINIFPGRKIYFK
jgi:hypothetical protein